MKISDAVRKVCTKGVVSPSRARILLGHIIKFSQEYVLQNPDHILTAQEIASFLSLCHRLENGEPLSRILGCREFWSLNFELSEHTLDPRSDSETLIEAVLKFLPDQKMSLRILDLGTGTGCLLIALLTEYKNSQGIGVDISTGALKTAQKNAAHHGVQDRVHFFKSNWFEQVEGNFDVIVSNPPYIKAGDYKTLDQNVKDFDPKIALVGGGDGLACYRQIIKTTPQHLKGNGILVLEIGYDQRAPVTRLLEDCDFKGIQMLKDLEDRARCLVAQKSA